MITALMNWLDDRTGIRALTKDALYERVPGGAKWRYVTGSMLVFAFVTQAVTGLILWMCYSPGSQNAWESVYYIQNVMHGGWLLRGVHHFMAQAMVVLLPIHLWQVVWDRAYTAPREVNYWLGLVLMLLVLGLSLTGYLLPWDQKGYWATQVATNLMSLAPGGPYLQKLVVGGSNYGHQTLTRFFAVHAGLLPALLVAFLGMHIAVFRRHGITTHPDGRRPDQFFWPHQILKDSVACLLLMILVLLLVVKFNPLAPFQTADAGALGAELSAPADPVEAYKAARPEWYFLFLFQLLKKFKNEFVGAIVVPGVIFGYLVLMPLIGRWKFGHYLNVVVLLCLVGGAGYLTAEALYLDNLAAWSEFKPESVAEGEARDQYVDRYNASQEFLAAVDQAHAEYERVRELAREKGIPREGALYLQRNDPQTMGPRLFARHCASCHGYLDEEGRGIAGPPPASDGEPNGGPNLYGFASRQWLAGFLTPEGIVSAKYFGMTRHAMKDADGAYPAGGMVEYTTDSLSELDAEQQAQLELVVAALSSEAALPAQAAIDQEAREAGQLDAGRQAFVDEFACSDCHKLGDEGDLGVAPDLSGWGSAAWLRLMIANPEHESMYGYEAADVEGNPILGNDRMPAFAVDPENPQQNLLSDHELDMLVRWLRGE